MRNPFAFNAMPDDMASPPFVMLIEDPRDSELAKLVLERAGYAVLNAAGEDELLAALETVTPDLLLVGWSNEGLDGLAVITRLKQEHPHLRRVPVILMADHRIGEYTRYDLHKLGVTWVLEKPVVATSLPKLIAATLGRRRPHIAKVQDLIPQQIGFGSTASAALYPAVV
jgi:DNA-binding response OmpR family regulator